MITNKILKNIASSFLLLILIMGKGNAALTDLATSPITVTGTSISALPNIMFVLDDSGSMQNDFLPDWADPLVSPEYLYKNAAYNGVAYNPATYYTPPYMYSTTGPDTTTYPVQNAANTSSWQAVKDDGYGVQSTATSDLTNNKAYYYTTIPGEYCDGPQLRNCTESATSTGTYTYPAKLRWCKTALAARGTIAQSNGNCQAAQISVTLANYTNSVAKYIFPRTPSLVPVATITLSGTGYVQIDSITVGSATGAPKILKASVSTTAVTNSTSFALSGILSLITDGINACTANATGDCTVSGYSATNNGYNAVTILAPSGSTTTAAPVVTKGTGTAVTVTVNGFSKTKGSVALIPITSATTTYAYPGTSAKSPNRIDCASTTCTYAEEMTNYANWWAYYHTRMQAMKTSVSTAFSNIDDQYRVCYFSINNGAGSDFININTFNVNQKSAWYTKFFSARPSGETPLRIALSKAGRVYAGKLTTVNGVSVTDPMQYSCQQNFTILSTDGYWNDSASATTVTQVNGTTAIGQQDGLEPRPYYDGSQQKQTTSQTTKTVTQKGRQDTVTYSSTWQQTLTTENLNQHTVTTVTYPYQIVERKLITTDWQLQKRYSTLNSRTVQITQSTSALLKKTYKPSQTTINLAKISLQPQQTIRALQKIQYQIYQRTTPALQAKDLVQQRIRKKINGSESWYYDSAFQTIAEGDSCVVGTNVGATETTETTCQYAGYGGYSPAADGSGTCTATTVNGYETGGTTVSDGKTIKMAIKCKAGTVGSALTSDSSDSKVIPVSTGFCKIDTSSPSTKPRVECYYDNGTTTTNSTATPVTSCTYNMPVDPASSANWTNYTKTNCTNDTTATAQPIGTCTVATTSYDSTTKTYTGDTVNCAYTTSSSATDVTSGTCDSSEQTSVAAGSQYKDTDKRCGYIGTQTGPTVVDTCQVKLGSAGPSYSVLATQSCTYPNINSPTTGPSDTGGANCQRIDPNPTADLTTNNATIRTQVVCSYDTWTNYADVSSCTVKEQTPDSGNVNGAGAGTIFEGPASHCSSRNIDNNNVSTCTANSTVNSSGQTTTCSTPGGFTNWFNVVSPDTCVPNAIASQSGNAYTAAVNCQYVLQGGAAATATCNVNTTAGSTNPPSSGTTDFTILNPRTCAYQSVADQQVTYGPSCVPATETPNPGPYTVLVARECHQGSYAQTPSPADQEVTSCITSDPAGVTVPPGTDPLAVYTNTVTTCSYKVASIAKNNAACDPNVPGTEHVMDAIVVGPPGASQIRTCGVDKSGTSTDTFVAVASCTPIETADSNFIPTSYDASGKNVQCKPDVGFGTYATVTPVQTCSSNTQPTSANNYVKRTCTDLQDTTPTPVQTCATQTASADNNWVSVSCATSTNGPSNIDFCTPQTATLANAWQTITCSSTGGTADTLADVAEYYYKTDLRTPGLENCTGSPVGTATVGNALCTTADEESLYNKVPVHDPDLNPAQHMTTFTLGLGASGFMQYTSKYASAVAQGGSPDYLAVLNGTTTNSSTGTCGWQGSGACNWPVPVTNDQSGIDDLWHAGVNGRGAYFSATDPTSLANSISTALASVNAARGSSTGVATSNPNISVNDNYIFSTTFSTGTWDGQIARQQINTTTGAVSGTPDWLAQAKLDNKSAASRVIWAFDGSSGAAANNMKVFNAANFGGGTGSTDPFSKTHISAASVGLSQFLCSSSSSCLTSTDQTLAAGNNLVNYLRGDRSNEGPKTDNTKYFRERAHILGDIVNSQSVYVSKPSSSFADAGYSAFATANASRLAVVYVGANDGMLHAFRAKGSATAEAAAATAAANNTPATVSAAIAAQAADVTAGVDGGQELWAYIPTVLLPNLYHLADKNYSNNHRYYVDGVQEVADVCISSCGTTSAIWKTILVGGLARGGRAYYALDITDPANPKALWEYTDSNLGYTYGNPQIGKLADGTWVVLFTSGYNNVTNDDGSSGDGQGRLYVLNAYTGAFIRSITTGVGTTSSPSGLSKIAAQVVNPIADNTIIAVYGGDLYGNLWRFDINNNIGVAGYDAQLLAQLSDSATSSGNPQPITTKPQVGLVDGNVVVYIGTGVYLASSDVDNKNVQSIYAIKDPLLTTGVASTAIYPNPRAAGGFVQQSQTTTTCPSGSPSTICVAGDSVRTSTNNAVSFSTNGGWYLDLLPLKVTGTGSSATTAPITPVGERANTDLVLGFGLLIFNTNTPEPKVCTLGGSSNQYYLDYRTGGPASSSTTGVIGVSLGNQLFSSPAIANVNGQGIAISVGSGDGSPTSKQVPPNPTPGDTRRTLWRELINQ